MGRFDEKVAVVVGAGSSGPGIGNGKAAALGFAREGATVVAVDISADALAETVDLIEGEGGRCIAVVGDVTQSDFCDEVAARAHDDAGGIDVLLNNVGIVARGGPLELDPAQWDRALAVNVTSFYLMMRATIPHLLESSTGSIVNVSSVAGIRYLGVPYISYAATKAAILGMTHNVAAQYARQGLRVNAVLPGLMDTPLISNDGFAASYSVEDIEAMKQKRARQVPMGFMGDAWDVARAVLFLASEDARYITGAHLVVDGGLTVATTTVD